VDGVVNADDYFQIDSGYITQAKGYQNGDFNYDGVINADDYFLIDSAFIGQRGALSNGMQRSAAVPEPAGLVLLAGGVVSLVIRRKRCSAGPGKGVSSDYRNTISTAPKGFSGYGGRRLRFPA
jgi:hypothetical protein